MGTHVNGQLQWVVSRITGQEPTHSMPRQARSVVKGTDTSRRECLIHVSVQVSSVRHSGEAAYCLHAVVFEKQKQNMTDV